MEERKTQKGQPASRQPCNLNSQCWIEFFKEAKRISARLRYEELDAKRNGTYKAGRKPALRRVAKNE